MRDVPWVALALTGNAWLCVLQSEGVLVCVHGARLCAGEALAKKKNGPIAVL